MFTGNGGNDSIVAMQEGQNYAIYRGARSEYAIASSDQISYDQNRGLTGLIVTDSHLSRDGTDKLVNIERLKFSDISIALDIGWGENAGAVYRLYEAAFNRAPKVGGQGYWLSRLDNGETLNQLAADFIQTDEFRSIYGENPTPVNFIYQLFNNILGRDPKQGGLNYWLEKLEQSSMAEVLAGIAESKENLDNTAPLIATGIPYQEFA